MKLGLTFILCALAFTVEAQNGTTPVFFQNGTGLISPAQTVNFSGYAPAHNTRITTEYRPYGVTFSPNVFYSPPIRNSHTPNLNPLACIGNISFIPRRPGGTTIPSISILFNAPVNDAAFSVQTEPGTIDIALLLNGVELPGGRHTFLGGWGAGFVNNFLGMQGALFDEIRITSQTSNHAIVIGVIQFSPSLASGGLAHRSAPQIKDSIPANSGNLPDQPTSSGLTTTTDAATGLSAKLKLDEFTHALDVQLVDKLGASKLFSVMEDKDVKAALQSPADPADTASHRKLAIASVNYVTTLGNRYGLPPQSSPAYDLKNADTLKQFTNAGISFLLITTVEDMDENHIDGATVTRDFEYVDGQRTGWWVQNLSASSGNDSFNLHRSGAGGGSSSWRSENVHVNPMKQKEQSIRVTLRSRLFDAKNGELLGSRNITYARGRSYMASAGGNNELSMGDLYQTAAGDLADWQRIIVEDDAFPIRVLQIETNNMVLINRGSESGIKINTYYDVFVKGERFKDPDTGELLDAPDNNVGRVLIRELQPKYSSAMVTGDGKGMVPGAILRLHH